MRKLGQVIRRRYPTAAVFLAVFLVVTVCDAPLPARDRSSVAAWASTSVANREHHPAGSLLLSAFIAGGSAYTWPALIFAGLTRLDVAAVGHVTAIAVAAAAVLLIWVRRPAIMRSGMNPCENLRCE